MKKNIIMKHEKLFKVFLYISLLILGAVAGIALGHYRDIPLAEEINLIDLATLVATVFLAVYVPAVLDRRLQTLRDRKDILEDRISDYQALLRRINMLVQSSSVVSVDTYLTIKNLMDISESKLNTLVSLIKNSGLKTSLNQDIAKIKKMNNEHNALLWIEADKVTNQQYSDQIREQEENLYNKLDEATSLLIFKISSSE
jgi:hypothetical protein